MILNRLYQGARCHCYVDDFGASITPSLAIDAPHEQRQQNGWLMGIPKMGPFQKDRPIDAPHEGLSIQYSHYSTCIF